MKGVNKMTVTLRQLDILIEHIDILTHELGIITDPEERLVLVEGSKAKGRAFRLYTTKGHAAFHIAGGGGFLGTTKPEAHRILSAIAQALGAVAYVQAKAKESAN